MKKLFLLLLLGFSGISCAALPVSGSLAPMLKQVTPAIVNISVRGQLPPLRLPFKLPKDLAKSPKFAGIGSGVIINANKGYILTNAHVVKDSKVILVTLHDGRRVQGTLVGADDKSDIAVIKVEAKHLTAIKFGDSSKLQVGDMVAAIGDPFGIGQTVTSGVVSGLGRTHLGIEGYENFIQTDAPINPGNSGGALINMQGQLVGINTAIITPYFAGGNVGIGLAIPSNMAEAVLEQIIQYGKVEHSLLGVLVQTMTPSLAQVMGMPNADGALVADVNSGTPAAEAGIAPKDVILSINGHQVKNGYQVSTEVGLMRPGTKLKIEVRRNGKIINLTATTMSLKKAKELAKKAPKELLSDVSLRNLTQLDNNQLIKGVQITQVGAFSYAFSCGLRPGDVILAAAGQAVESAQELQKIAQEHPDRLLLTVKPLGQQGNIYLVLEK